MVERKSENKMIFSNKYYNTRHSCIRHNASRCNAVQWRYDNVLYYIIIIFYRVLCWVYCNSGVLHVGGDPTSTKTNCENKHITGFFFFLLIIIYAYIWACAYVSLAAAPFPITFTHTDTHKHTYTQIWTHGWRADEGLTLLELRMKISYLYSVLIKRYKCMRVSAMVGTRPKWNDVRIYWITILIMIVLVVFHAYDGRVQVCDRHPSRHHDRGQDVLYQHVSKYLFLFFLLHINDCAFRAVLRY